MYSSSLDEKNKRAETELAKVMSNSQIYTVLSPTFPLLSQSLYYYDNRSWPNTPGC